MFFSPIMGAASSKHIFSYINCMFAPFGLFTVLYCVLMARIIVVFMGWVVILLFLVTLAIFHVLSVIQSLEYGS